jgi:EF-hand domain
MLLDQSETDVCEHCPKFEMRALAVEENGMYVLQIQQLRQVFDDIDQSGDGFVDRTEFRRYMSQLESQKPHLARYNDAESIFFSLDRHKNGTLCFADVRHTHLKQTTQSPPERGVQNRGTACQTIAQYSR